MPTIPRRVPDRPFPASGRAGLGQYGVRPADAATVRKDRGMTDDALPSVEEAE